MFPSRMTGICTSNGDRCRYVWLMAFESTAYCLFNLVNCCILAHGSDRGDANIIDLFQYGPDGIFSDNRVRRTLIDTGPPNKQITAAILHALKTRTLPVRTDDNGIPIVPIPNVPRIEELQVREISSQPLR
jgi:hypothetical protein